MRSPYDLPTVEQLPPVQQQPTNQGSFLVIVGLAVAALFFAFRSEFALPIHDVKPDNDTVVVVDPPKPDDKKDTSPVSLKDSYIVAVYETTSDKMPVWMVNLFEDSDFWNKWLTDNGMFFQKYSPVANPDAAKSFINAAAKRDIKPPFVVHADKGGNVLSVTSLEKEITTDDLKSKITKGK